MAAEWSRIVEVILSFSTDCTRESLSELCKHLNKLYVVFVRWLFFFLNAVFLTFTYDRQKVFTFILVLFINSSIFLRSLEILDDETNCQEFLFALVTLSAHILGLNVLCCKFTNNCTEMFK